MAKELRQGTDGTGVAFLSSRRDSMLVGSGCPIDESLGYSLSPFGLTRIPRHYTRQRAGPGGREAGGMEGKPHPAAGLSCFVH